MKSRLTSTLRHFLQSESAGGIILMLAAAAALIVANSPLAAGYNSALSTYVGGLSVLHWINDALMAVFFLLVGLEIKRELVSGQLRTWQDRALPGMAALGGMVAPALVFVAINAGAPETLNGWAIPAATDIAFALGVLSLLGSRTPVSLKVLLTALAIIDDLGAIVIIALFYTAGLDLLMLGASAAALAALFALNRAKMTALWPYLLIGAVLWFFVLKSGVHATLAGVALAFFIPHAPRTGHEGEKDEEAGHGTPLLRLEHALHYWVAFLIVPIFGFANAGVSLAGLSFEELLQPLPLGIMAGLFLGKQVGIMAFCWLSIRLRIATLPAHANWGQLYGVALLCGIGFTMSLFIGLLAFPTSPLLQDELKIGVLGGSILSALVGAVALTIANRRAKPVPDAS